VVDDTVVEDVAWSYEDPLPETRPIRGHFSFDETRADVLAELPASFGTQPDAASDEEEPTST
jgi:uncharacterized protein (DUF427 family)